MTATTVVPAALQRDRRAPAYDWLDALADRGTLLVDPARATPVITAVARVCGKRVYAFAMDARAAAGAMTDVAADAVATHINAAREAHAPVVGLWESAGASVRVGPPALGGLGRLFSAQVRASGAVPQISVVMGAAAGGAAYGPALSDIVIAAPEARMFLTGPKIVHAAIGEVVDAETLGGTSVHAARSGLMHVVANSRLDAVATARQTVDLLARRWTLPATEPAVPGGPALPASPRRAYDVRQVIERILDGDPRPVYLHDRWARNIVTALGRIRGRSVGVVANNPIRLAGCLDGTASDKAARFVRMCDGLGIPLIVLVDVPGFLPGARQETDGVIRRGAKLVHAFAAAEVPRFTVVMRKAYGGAFIAMNSKSLGADRVLAWPCADIGVMSGATATLLTGVEPEQPPERMLAAAVAEGLIDEVIPLEVTRARLAELLERTPARAGRQRNIQL